jgi:hypothetical protein
VTGVDWPPELGEPTPAGQRTKNWDFSATLGKTTEQLETELDRLDPDDWRVETGNQHTKTNGMPRHNANPDDPAFVLHWTKNGDSYAVGCDRYSRLRDNVRTVYLWFHETRMRSKRPVSTAEASFAAAKLPPANEDAVAGDPPAHAVLDIDPDASDDEVIAAYRELAKQTHGDVGGDPEDFKRVKRAKETMLG